VPRPTPPSPRSPSSTLRLYSEGGATQLHSAKLYRLGL